MKVNIDLKCGEWFELLWQGFLSTQRLTRYTDGGCVGGGGGYRSGGDPVVEEPALPV